MRTKLLMIALLFASALPAMSQVKWNFRAVQTGELDFEVHITALVQPNWHIYSQRAEKGVAAHVKFLDNPMVTRLSKTQEMGKLITNKSDESHSKYYEGYVSFVRPVHVKDTETPIALRGFITYQLCNGEEDSKHQRQEFTVILKKEE